MNVELNAVDPRGEDPPDELFHRPGDGRDTALVRTHDGWELRLYYDDEEIGREEFDDFETAFVEFASYAYDVAETRDAHRRVVDV